MSSAPHWTITLDGLNLPVLLPHKKDLDAIQAVCQDASLSPPAPRPGLVSLFHYGPTPAPEIGTIHIPTGASRYAVGAMIVPAQVGSMLKIGDTIAVNSPDGTWNAHITLSRRVSQTTQLPAIVDAYLIVFVDDRYAWQHKAIPDSLMAGLFDGAGYPNEVSWAEFWPMLTGSAAGPGMTFAPPAPTSASCFGRPDPAAIAWAVRQGCRFAEILDWCHVASGWRLVRPGVFESLTGERSTRESDGRAAAIGAGVIHNGADRFGGGTVPESLAFQTRPPWTPSPAELSREDRISLAAFSAFTGGVSETLALSSVAPDLGEITSDETHELRLPLTGGAACLRDLLFRSLAGMFCRFAKPFASLVYNIEADDDDPSGTDDFTRFDLGSDTLPRRTRRPLSPLALPYLWPNVLAGTVATTTTAETGELPECQGRCRYIWTAEGGGTGYWTLAHNGCQAGTTSTTSTEEGVTTSEPTPTTAECFCYDSGGDPIIPPAPVCDCIPPDFCGQEDGECVYTDCTTEAQTYRAANCTRTTAGTTTSYDCSTTTTAAKPPGCTSGCDWLGVPAPGGGFRWLNVRNGCSSNCPCPPPMGAPANCDVATTECVPLPEGGGGPDPFCGGGCLYWWVPSLNRFVLVENNCIALGSPCYCTPPSQPGTTCAPYVTGCRPPVTPPVTTTTPPVHPCYTTSTSTTTTTTTECQRVCRHRAIEEGEGFVWQLDTTTCPEGCPCGPPPFAPTDGCEVFMQPCGTAATSTSTTTTLEGFRWYCNFDTGECNELPNVGGGYLTAGDCEAACTAPGWVCDGPGLGCSAVACSGLGCYPTEADCLVACGPVTTDEGITTSTTTTTDEAPWWCNSGDCGFFTGEPGATGPYASLPECEAACYGITTDEGVTTTDEGITTMEAG